MVIKEVALGVLSVLYILILAGGLIYIPIACVVGLALGIAEAMQ